MSSPLAQQVHAPLVAEHAEHAEHDEDDDAEEDAGDDGALEALVIGAIMEVAVCEPDHEGEWDGDREGCTIVADHGATCDVQCLSDGELCVGVQRRHVRSLPARAGKPPAQYSARPARYRKPPDA